MLLVLDLQLMKVDELEVITHLLLVLDLILRLHDLRLQRLILQRQLLDQRVLRLLLVLQVLHELLSVVLAGPAVFSGGEEATEVEGFLTDLGDGEVGALQDGLETLEECLGAITTRLDAQLQSFQLSVRDFVLLLRCQLPL